MTIEERATERCCKDCIFPQFQGNDACEECSARDNYIKIAIEQKAIDDEEHRKYLAYLAHRQGNLIDKACEWFKKNYREYVLGGEDMIEAFRKAMEEQL